MLRIPNPTQTIVETMVRYLWHPLAGPSHRDPITSITENDRGGGWYFNVQGDGSLSASWDSKLKGLVAEYEGSPEHRCSDETAVDCTLHLYHGPHNQL